MDIRDTIRALRDHLKKEAFIPMPGDVPQQSAPPPMPQGGGMPPEAAGQMPPQGAPPMQDPSMMQGGGMPPQAAGPDPAMADANGEVIEQLLQGMQELAQVFQQFGQEIEKRIAPLEQGMDQMSQTIGQMAEEQKKVMEIVTQNAAMDGSIAQVQQQGQMDQAQLQQENQMAQQQMVQQQAMHQQQQAMQPPVAAGGGMPMQAVM